MLKILKLAVLLSLVFMPAAYAQTASPAATQKPEPDFVTEKGFKSKVFEVKFRDVGNLASVLRPLGSGFKGASVSSNSEFKTITVRDFPENMATIEEALKRLDAPAPPRPNIELHMHVLIASNAAAAPAAETPAELKDVLAQLRGTLNYKNYELAISVVQRLAETNHGLRGKGTAEISGGASGPSPLPYEYIISGASLVQNAKGAQTVQIGQFSFYTISEKNSAQVETALNLRDGEKVVVGTATIRERALIVVLTAKLIE